MESSERSLRILHVLRAPVGGLFRHVQDLALEQAARGHAVGLIADSSTGGEQAKAQFAQLGCDLRLGVTRFPMRREPHRSDLPAILRVTREILRLKPDVVHGHGSKGGLYARASGFLPCPGSPLRVYTPHGGSFHDQPGRGIYLTVERLAAARTAEQLRKNGYSAPVTVVSDEQHLPYDRPPLSKEVLQRADTGLDDVLLKPAEFYADSDIALKLGSSATLLDPAARTVALASISSGVPAKMSRPKSSTKMFWHTWRTSSMSCSTSRIPMPRSATAVCRIRPNLWVSPPSSPADGSSST